MLVAKDRIDHNSSGGNGLRQLCQAFHDLGDQYASIGDHTYAQRCYEKAVSLEPDRSKPYRAFQMYLKCLESDTDNITALLGLFRVSRQIDSFSKVTHHMEAYVKIHPGDTKVMFCLATLYMKDGRLNEAKKVLAEVLGSEPGYTNTVNLLEEVEHRLMSRN